MANETITMAKLKNQLLHLAEGASLNDIIGSLHMSKKTIIKYKRLAQTTGRTFRELSNLSPLDLEKLFMPSANAPKPDARKAALDSVMDDLLKSRNKYTTADLLWQRYRELQPDGYGYTQFKKYYQDELKSRHLSFTKTYKPGEVWQIDFAGDPLYLRNPRTKESTSVVVLVCIMPYSQLAFCTALPNSTQEQLFHGLSKGLEYMGAVPHVALSDNMKQWVDHNKGRYEPPYTETTTRWANHYGIRPDVCRVRHPKDKAPVESLVNQLYKYIYARILNENHPTIDHLNNRILELLDEFNSKDFRDSSSRWDIFREEELPAMKPLPESHYSFYYEKTVTLRSDYHVTVGPERHRYSVPYRYVNQELTVRWNLSTVEIYKGLERIAVHDRSTVPHRPSTKEEHMPEQHKAYLRMNGTNAASLLDRATFVGESTRWAIDMMLRAQSHPEHAYQGCMGVLGLMKRYGRERLESACSVVRSRQARPSYRMISNILEHNRDKDGDASIVSETPHNPNTRGASAFS